MCLLHTDKMSICPRVVPDTKLEINEGITWFDVIFDDFVVC